MSLDRKYFLENLTAPIEILSKLHRCDRVCYTDQRMDTVYSLTIGEEQTRINHTRTLQHL
jgi:hypothetical protein